MTSSELVWPEETMNACYYRQKLDVISVTFVLATLVCYVKCSSLETNNSYSKHNDSDDGVETTLYLNILAGGILFAVLVVLAVTTCSKCWPLKPFGRGRGNGQTNVNSEIHALNGSTSSLAQIDVRELELDPVVFEPLPTLTPLHLTLNERNAKSTLDEERYARYVPYVSEESSIYAHDWFDEPFSNFPRGNLEYINEVATGWFGKVIEAEARDIVPYARRIKVVVKVLKDDSTGHEQMRFLDEARLFRDSSHANIMQLLGHSIEMSPFLLIMQHYPENLKSFLISNVSRADFLNKKGDVIKMMIDVAKALDWMEKKEFVLADLCLRNCMIGADGRIVVGDGYGLSTSIFKSDYYWTNNNTAIPLRWLSPESVYCTFNTIQTLRITKFGNIYTFGILLWELCEFGKIPYFEFTDEEVICRVIQNSYFLGQPTISTLKADRLYTIMKACWNRLPYQRPKFSFILSELHNIFFEIQNVSKDDFDSKWEELGTSNSQLEKGKTTTHELLKKKSVRFSWVEKEGAVCDTSEVHSIKGSEKNHCRPCASVSNCDTHNSNTRKYRCPLPVKVLHQQVDDLSHRVESGRVTVKVQEKSRNVQDLMVLTHVELSDLDYSSSPENHEQGSARDTANSDERVSCSTHTNGIQLDQAGLPAVDSYSVKFGTQPSRNNESDNISIYSVSQQTSTGVVPNGGVTNDFATVLGFGSSSSSGRDLVKATVNQGPSNEPPRTGTAEDSRSSLVVLGPSEELGIDIFQLMSTEIIDPSFSREFSTTDTKRETSQVLQNGASLHQQDSSPHFNERVFPDNPDHELRSENEEKTVDPFDYKLPLQFSANVYNGSTFGAERSDFWDRQIKSLKEATSDTMQLFQLGLNDEQLSPRCVLSKFDSGIKIHSEEFDSSILQDLDMQNSEERDQHQMCLKNNALEPQAQLVKCLTLGDELTSLRESNSRTLVKMQSDNGASNDLLVQAEVAGNSNFGSNLSEDSIKQRNKGSFIPSKWNQHLVPSKPAIKSPETAEKAIYDSPTDTEDYPHHQLRSGLQKSVSFENRKTQLVYEYPPAPQFSDSEEEEKVAGSTQSCFSSSLDWELDPDEMSDGNDPIEDPWEHNWSETSKSTCRNSSLDLYRIGFVADSPSPAEDEQEGFSKMTAVVQFGLGELRHTRERLKLDLTKEASVLDDRNSQSRFDSGLGSSANVSPFNHCDNDII